MPTGRSTRVVMKNVHPLAVFIAAVSLLISACSATQKHCTSSKQAAVANLEKKSPVHVGMSKADVVAIWGKPTTRTVNSKGEVWTWSGSSWIRRIPLIGDHYDTELYSADFGTNGKVTEYRIHQVFGHAGEDPFPFGSFVPSSVSK